MITDDTLKLIGWPTDLLLIDFETYFDTDYSITKMSTIEYITDDRFAFTGMGYTDTNMFNEFVPPKFTPGVESRIKILQGMYGENFEKCVVVAKNCKFDITALAVKFNIFPEYTIDIDDLARHYDSRMNHHLKYMAPAFHLEAKGDTGQFKGLHWEDMDSKQKRSLEEYCLNDVILEAKLLEILFPFLTAPEIELPHAKHTLDLYLKPRIKFDFFGALDLSMQMDGILDEFITPTGFSRDQISGMISFTKLLMNNIPDGETVTMKPGKPTKGMIELTGVKGMIPAFAATDVAFQELLAHTDPVIRKLCEARQAIKSWPNHIKRIDSLIKQANCSNGMLRVPLHYYGCHTGRPSGGEGINLLNLGGRGRAGKGTHPLIQKIRGLLQAPEGHTFCMVDSAQIEARMLAWIAGCTKLVTGFANGEDIYSDFASSLFGNPVRKPDKDDPEMVANLLKIQRGFGKDGILGAGYGMGFKLFFERCMSNPELRPAFESGKYNIQFIERLIKLYRKTYYEIPIFWNEVEKCFRRVIKYPKDVVSYHIPDPKTCLHEHLEGSDPVLKNSLLTFWNENGTVNLQLPSGRVLYYRHASIGRDHNIRWQHGYLWGGSITENIIQSIARDMLVDWINGCEMNEMPVVYHCYDEIVTIAPDDEAEFNLSAMMNIMRSGPSWADGCPFDAEGELSKVYKK